MNSPDASTPLLLPLSLVETLLGHTLSLRPRNGKTNLRPEEEEAWKDGLRTWRNTLAAMDTDHRVALLKSRSLWDKAMEAVGVPNRRGGSERPGDWDDIPASLKEEVALWKKEGLIQDMPVSSMELPALALAAMAQTHEVTWSDCLERIRQAFNANAPSVMAALLDLEPNLDLDELFKEPGIGSGNLVDSPLAHDLFTRHFQSVSDVIQRKGRVPPSAAHAVDSEGLTALARNQTDLEAAKRWLKAGADPNALSPNGLLPEETGKGSVGEPTLEFHALLQAHRSASEALRARSRLGASALARTPFAQTQAMGLFAEVVANPSIDMGEERLGILSYIQRFADWQYHGKECLTSLSRLLASRNQSSWIFAAEGGQEKGVAVALDLVAAAADRDWQERGSSLAKALQSRILHCDRQTLIEELVRQPHLRSPDQLCRIMGKKGLVANAIQEIPASHWKTLLPHVSQNWSEWAPPPLKNPDNSKWREVLDAATDALVLNPPTSMEDKAAWMAGLMQLLVVGDRTHPAYRQVMDWVGEGIVPTWPTKEVETRTMRWLTAQFHGFKEQMLEARLTRRIPDAPTPSAMRPRM